MFKQSPAGVGDEGDRTKCEARTRERENSGKTKRLRGIGCRRNERTKQFEHETKCDLRADVRHGATGKQNTVILGRTFVRNFDVMIEFKTA